MNILLIYPDDELLNEMQDLTEEYCVALYVANSQDEALSILSKTPVHKVLFALRTVADLEFLSYMNIRYKALEVILTLGEQLHEIVKVLREGQYSMLKVPPELSELQNIVSNT